MTKFNLPVKPSEFRAVVPAYNDSLCDVLVKFFKFTVLFWKWYRWFFVYNTGAMQTHITDAICEVRANCGTGLED